MTAAAAGSDGWRPRLVASDLDGTLLQPDGTVSPRTRRAVARVEEAGALFVMVTGRPPRWMAPLREQLPPRGLALCANGAVVYDLAAQRVVREDAVPLDVATRLVEALRDAVPGVAFAAEGTDGFGHEPTYRPAWDSPDQLVAEVEVLLREPRWKLLVRHPDLDADTLLTRSRDAVGELATLTHSSASGGALVEVSAAGITKASALARLAEEHGVAAEDVLAFGDMPNDLPMLAWAGRGLAVGNAHPEVLEIADGVVGRHDEDGVAEVLEALFA